MASEVPSAFAVRLYALLLYLYPAPFRREYGESMLQLFNDQRRAARGAGGYVMLWLKTLLDLARSVPAAHANAPGPSRGVVLVWSIVAILVVLFVVNALVLPNWISRMPSGAEAAQVAAAPELVAGPGPSGEYRAVARIAVAVLSTLLAFGAFLFALRQRFVLSGMAAFVAGGALTFVALATNPWIWLPLDQYPVAIAWALGIWPFAAVAWIALRVAARLNPGT